jgi:hypothetical protein
MDDFGFENGIYINLTAHGSKRKPETYEQLQSDANQVVNIIN